jgi:hypothetical protein
MTSAGEYEIRIDADDGDSRAAHKTVDIDSYRDARVSQRSTGEASSTVTVDDKREASAPTLALRALCEKSRQFWRDFSAREASGALGDLGTFLPLLVGMSVECGVDAGTTILFTGAYNILTAFLYEIPMPVQPMKTIAAVALGDSPLNANEIMVAGLFVSGVVFVLGATRMMDTFNKLTPLAVVQGMQVGLGMLLARKGFLLAVYSSSDTSQVRNMLGTDGLLVTIVAMCAVMYVSAPEYPRIQSGERQGGALAGNERTKRRRHYTPMALILVMIGIVMAMAKDGAFDGLSVGPATPKILSASWAEAKRGIINAGIPQLPLTTLNSVISVCALSKELFPDSPASPSSVASSVGMMNMIGCWVGAMPSCHGAGGLAAQYAFGARGGGSVVFLGTCKIILGLLFGSSLVQLLEKFPKTILGVMLFSSSLELIGMGLKTKPGWQQHQKYLVMVTAAVTIATKSTAVGFAAGIGTHILMEVQRYIERDIDVVESPANA